MISCRFQAHIQIKASKDIFDKILISIIAEVIRRLKRKYVA